MRQYALHGNPGQSMSAAVMSILVNAPALIQFAGKAVLPVNLTVLPTMVDTTCVYGAVVVCVAGILAGFRVVRHLPMQWGRLLFGVAWFAGFLLLSFVRPEGTRIPDFVEHRAYVPVFGAILVLLELAPWTLLPARAARAWVPATAVAVIAVFAGATLYHQRHFVNRMAFWRDAAAHSPQLPLAHLNLGAMDYLDGNLVDAWGEYQKVLELNPTEAKVHNNLGLILAAQGNSIEAEKEYLREIAINPSYADAHYNLGLLYARVNLPDAAKEQWRIALQCDPNHRDARAMLAGGGEK